MHVCVCVHVHVIISPRYLPFLFLFLLIFYFLTLFSLSLISFILHRGDVMNRCAKYLSKPAVSSSGQPVRVTKLIRKNFVEKHQLQSDLLSKISLVEGERVYFDSDRRHHKSDGIIFQPDSPYTFSIDSDLLKWKWSEVRSVDLQVVLTPTPGMQSGSKGKMSVVLCCVVLCCEMLFFSLAICHPSPSPNPDRFLSCTTTFSPCLPFFALLTSLHTCTSHPLHCLLSSFFLSFINLSFTTFLSSSSSYFTLYF